MTEFEIVKTIVIGLLSIIVFFSRKTLSDLEKKQEAQEAKLNTLKEDIHKVREEYIHSDELKEFKKELKAMLDDFKSDIRAMLVQK